VNGTARQLLFADIIGAIINKRYENSSWHCLPKYTGVEVDAWDSILKRDSFVREFWPAQHLLGIHGVFKGRSAVVQMPTSAGKTKATEIIIRSSFLSGRTNFCVIVAPFKALCQEIRDSLVKAFTDDAIRVNDISDILMPDFGLEEFIGNENVLVVTPEKLLYMLRQNPAIAAGLGLLIYDEGHQFDSGTRGITYELLIASLKSLLPDNVQQVLISAVISNADAVGLWLNGEGSEVVVGGSLIPTHRTVAFASWLDQLGRLEFVEQSNPEKVDFFVPRIIERHQLNLLGKEHKKRFFPDREDGQSVALYLALTLVPNGAVAIFCGTKSSAVGVCTRAINAYMRELSLPQPSGCSDRKEVARLHYLYGRNLGNDSSATKCAEMGIYSHHANTPHGIKLAVEYAMKEGLIKFVVCTSTLAQGVNLPIRYLIVTSVYQGGEPIKVRDFHNLIGRAGRSGMHTEGSIIFADPDIYDKRKTSKKAIYRWESVKKLLNPENSEPCASSLLAFFYPLIDRYSNPVGNVSWLKYAEIYLDSIERASNVASILYKKYGSKYLPLEAITKQLFRKNEVIPVIESYLLANISEFDLLEDEDHVGDLAKDTLAYSMAGKKSKKDLVSLFVMLARNIATELRDHPRKLIYGKSFYGVRKSIEIDNWVVDNLDDIITCTSYTDALKILWPVISQNITNNTFQKCSSPELLLDVACQWAMGESFERILENLSEAGGRLIHGKGFRNLNIEHIVDICEKGLSYDGGVVINSVATILAELIDHDINEGMEVILQGLQRRLRYGVPSDISISLYELGFSDRVVSQELAEILHIKVVNRLSSIIELKSCEKEVRRILIKYPAYFTQKYDELIEG
jgi:POLQ-like helicase